MFWVLQDVRSPCPWRQRWQSDCRLLQYTVFNELFREEAVTTYGTDLTLSCSSRDPRAQWPRGSWLITGWPVKCSAHFFLGYCAKDKKQRREKASLLIIRMFSKRKTAENGWIWTFVLSPGLLCFVIIVNMILCQLHMQQYREQKAQQSFTHAYTHTNLDIF